MTEANGKGDGGERIARRMARAGVASRRTAETMIAEGRVSVNGVVIDSPALNVTARDRIAVDGRPLAAPEPPRLWRYYKPLGLVTSERDEKGRETVFDHLPEDLPRVVSVGRLDLNSEGLLLLTNDGALKRRLELPSTGWLRKYRVRAHGEADDAVLEPLRRGIVIDGERFQPMTVAVDRQQGSNVWLTVALREGKNREVRRALDAVGLQVNRLIRVSYGPFQLGELQPGQVEEIRPKAVREQLGLGPAGGKADGKADEARGPTGGAKARNRRTDIGKDDAGQAVGGKVSSGAGGGRRSGALARAAGAGVSGEGGRAGKIPGRTTGQPTGRMADKMAGPGAGQAAGKPTGKVPARMDAKPAGTTTAKPLGKQPGAPEKPAGKAGRRETSASGGRGKPAPHKARPLTPSPRRPK